MIDWKNIYELAIANIPTLSVVVVGVLSALKKIKYTAKKYPDITKVMKEEIMEEIANQKKSLEIMQVNFMNSMKELYETSKREIDESRKESIKILKQFSNTQLQLNALIKQNKASFEIISSLIAKDSSFIKNGVSSMVIDISNKSKKEIEKLSKEISTDYNVLKGSVSELLVLVGEDNFKKILEEIGYEKNKTEKLQNEIENI